MHHILVTATAMAAAVAVTAPVHAKDRTGYHAISAQDYAGAERRLTAERRIFPNRPELMLNLAAVYLKTGRAEQARALYAEVLDRPAAAMDMPSGRVASSHAVAGTALASLNSGTAFAAR